MNRHVAIGLGIFGLSMGVSYVGFTAGAPGRRIVVQRRAVPPPAAEAPAPAPAEAPARPASPSPAVAPAPEPEPDPSPGYVAEPEAVAPSTLPGDYAAAEPYNPATDPRRPLVDTGDYLRRPARSRRASSVPPQPEPEAPVRPEGFCLACGAPTDNWVEVDGRKQGYCRKHMGRVRIPVSPPASARVAPRPAPAAAAYSASPESRSGGEGASAQCRGVTKSGAPCRRKTRDPSGFCYQHRGQQ